MFHPPMVHQRFSIVVALFLADWAYPFWRDIGVVWLGGKLVIRVEISLVFGENHLIVGGEITNSALVFHVSTVLSHVFFKIFAEK